MKSNSSTISLDVLARFLRELSIPRDAFVEFAEQENIPLGNFFGDINEQKAKLCELRQEFKKTIEKASKQGGVLAGFRCLPENLLLIVKIMDPLNNLSGRSEDEKRLRILEKLVEIMRRHIRIREETALNKSA